MTYYNINGEIVSAQEARLGVMDLAILRGYGVFDYFLVRAGRPMFFNDYIDRFENSIRVAGLKLPISRQELQQRIMHLITANGKSEAAIRLVLTGGYAADSFTPDRPNLLILQHEQPTYPAEWFTKGQKLITYQYVRELPEAKTINYVTGIRALQQIKAANAYDLIYHDGQYISESARSNIFIVTNEGTLVTPGTGILKGITRKKHLSIAPALGIKVEERKVTLEELFTSKEVFLCSSTKGALPIVQIDEQIIGDGKVGMLTNQLSQKLQEFAKNYLKSPLEV